MRAASPDAISDHPNAPASFTSSSAISRGPMISLNQLEPVDLRKFPPWLGRMTPASHFVTIVAMRRTLVALALVAAAGVVGALAYASYSTEQEFVRLVASGDEAAEAGRAF